MKKILASLLAITMLMTTLSACVIPVSAADAAVATSDGSFTETFEGYGSGNWLANMAEDGLYVGTAISGMEANKWKVYSALDKDSVYNISDIASKASLEVVADPADSTNKVLKMDAGDLTDKEYIYLRRNVNGTDKIAHTDLQGKKMVIKAKFKVPTGFNMTTDTSMLAFDRLTGKPNRYCSSDQHGANYSDKSWTILAMDSKNYGSNLNVKKAATVPENEWFDIKFVFNLSGDLTAENPADTYRGFFNNSIYTMNLPALTASMTGAKIKEMNSKFPQPSSVVGEAGEKIVDSTGGYTTAPTNSVFQTFGDFYGTSMMITGAEGSTTDYLYMDDLMVYYIDDFKQEGAITLEYADQTDWYKGEIRIPFSNDLMAVVKENGTTLDYKSLFTLKDASGNVVENGIESASVDGNVLVITPSSMIERDATYTIVADALFMDEEGQGLNQYSDPTELGTFKAIVDPYAHIYFDEDFEDYTSIIGQNWASSVNSSTNYVTLAGVEENAWKIGSSAGTSSVSSGSVKVVADPKNSGRGNVLEIDTGSIASGKNITVLKTPGESTISRSTMTGKRIVIEGDIYIPADSTLDEDTGFAYYNGNNGMNTSRPNGYILPYNSITGANIYTIGSGSYGTIASGRSRYSAGGNWHTYRYVIDVSGTPSANRVDTVRGYIDGTLMVGVLAGEGTTTAATNTNYPIYEADGSTPLQIVDFWKRVGVWDSTAAANYSAGDFYGVFMSARTKGRTVNKYYVDNMKAYYVDDLALTAPDLSDFTGGGINLTFNQKIDNADNFDVLASTKANFNSAATKLTLKDMFTILDEDGNDIEGIKSATVSADGKTVTILPQNIEANSDYTLVISRYFRDAEGQGLTKNSTEYEIEMHVGEFVPFELKEISQTEVSGFAQGRDVKVTAEFSMNITDDMLSDGIVVTDSEGNTVARNAGWTATIDAENAKVVVFDFGSLPTDSYEVTTNENFAIAGEALSNTLSITITAAAQPIELFNETFESGYTVDDNWIKDENAVTDGTLYNGKDYGTSKSYFKSYTVNNHDWDIQRQFVVASTDTEPADVSLNGDFVGVVAAPSAAAAKMSGNVLKISNSRGTAYASNYVSFRRNFNKLNGIDFSSEQYKGKKLVYEADVYADRVAGDTSFLVPFGASSAKAVRDYNDWKMTFNSDGLRSPGHYSNAFASVGPMAMFTNVTTDSIAKVTSAPVNYKMVVSMGENVDTLAYYVNGTLVQRSEANQAVLVGHEYNDSARHEFAPSDGTYGETLEVNDVLYGIWGLASKNSTNATVAPSTIYVDNFKAYLVDEFVVESVTGAGNAFNVAKGTVDYTFSKAVDETSIADGVVLLDAEGNEIAGIDYDNTGLSDGGYKLSVDLLDTLNGKTSYTIKLTEQLRDVDGLPLSTKWKEYTYPIDDYYTGTDNVYSITSVAGAGPIDCTYTAATATTPAYLAYGSNKIAVDTWVRDADAMKMYASLTTAKSISLCVEEATASISGNAVTVNAKFSNPETTAKPIWAVVAVYGEYNEMLGCEIANVTEIAAGTMAEDNITVNVADSSKVELVKLHIWNSYEDMVPYHKAETLLEPEDLLNVAE